MSGSSAALSIPPVAFASGAGSAPDGPSAPATPTAAPGGSTAAALVLRPAHPPGRAVGSAVTRRWARPVPMTPRVADYRGAANLVGGSGAVTATLAFGAHAAAAGLPRPFDFLVGTFAAILGAAAAVNVGLALHDARQTSRRHVRASPEGMALPGMVPVSTLVASRLALHVVMLLAGTVGVGSSLVMLRTRGSGLGVSPAAAAVLGGAGVTGSTILALTSGLAAWLQFLSAQEAHAEQLRDIELALRTRLPARPALPATVDTAALPAPEPARHADTSRRGAA